MKKTLTLLAILAAIGPAWGAEVVSSNVVGYEKVNLVKGFTQIGVQFQNVGATDGSIMLNDLSFSGLAGYDFDNFLTGDTVTMWDAASQSYSVTYSWSGNGSTEYAIPANVWFDEGEFTGQAEVPLEAGSSVFVRSAAAAGMTQAGEVIGGATVKKDLSKGFTQLANPFPVAFDINDATYEGLAGYDFDNFLTGDTLTMWDAATQSYSVTYSWSGNGSTEYAIPANVWFDEGDFTGQAVVDIPVAGSIFIKAANGGSVTFANPLSE